MASRGLAELEYESVGIALEARVEDEERPIVGGVAQYVTRRLEAVARRERRLDHFCFLDAV